jgi:N utilization substance protein B
MNKPRSLRSEARTYALQAIYSWLISGNPMDKIKQEWLASINTQISDPFYEKPEYLLVEMDEKQIDRAYFDKLLSGIARHHETLNEVLAPSLSRPLEELTPIEHAILWIGAFELTQMPDVPYRVVINESVELAKLFGAQDSHKFINGVLDKLAKSHRPNG